MGGHYKIDSDTLNDFGVIELSANKGRTWYDLVNGEGAGDFWWDNRIPVSQGA